MQLAYDAIAPSLFIHVELTWIPNRIVLFLRGPRRYFGNIAKHYGQLFSIPGGPFNGRR
jgi:hypothetical protein